MKLKRFLSDNFSLGKGSIKIPAEELINKYRNNYHEAIKKGLKFPTDLYWIAKESVVVVHVKVPSESVKNFYYDVLIQFEKDGKDFEDCHIKIFSNSPSFVYTYAYVFYHLEDDEREGKGMIIDDYDKKIPKERLLVSGAENKLDKEVLHGYPTVRNPYGLPLFDKTVYYAIFNIIENFDFNRVIHNKRMVTRRGLFDNIKDFDTLMIMRKAEEDKQRENNRVKKESNKLSKIFKNTEKENSRLSKDDSSIHILKPMKASKSESVKKVKPISSKKR